MCKNRNILITIGINIIPLVPIIIWIILVIKGKQFALRNRLQKADAIIVLAGTRGNIKFLDGKIQTAVHLYQRGWAPSIIAVGKFSAKIAETPNLIPLKELEEAVLAGRIEKKDLPAAAKTWDTDLGATYIREQATQMGIPVEDILAETNSLHTKENAEYTLQILKKQNMHRIILITSPFHQLRTYLTFQKVFQPYNIQIINYYAETGEWNPATWFFSEEHRRLVKSEKDRIKRYREKGDL
jgi:uncharacterized SAM-binding protein YcdF (DUF218 family)